MDYDPKDNEVILLLKKLKDSSNGIYPQEMLAFRRRGYLKQAAEATAGAGLAFGLRNLAKGGKGAAGLPSATGTIVEVLLVVALVAEVGAVTYFNRSKLVEFFRSITHSPKVEEVSGTVSLPSSTLEVQLTPTPVVTSTGTRTATSTPPTSIGTPSQELPVETGRPNEGSNGVNGQSVPTSVPKDNSGGPAVSTQAPPKSNNGNHYGQTPKPERTKKPGNNTSSTQADAPDKKNKP